MTSIPNTQTTSATPYDAKTAAVEVARLLSDDRCSDVTLLDVRGISSVQDFVILASGTSDRQMRSAASDIRNLMPKLGSSVYRTSIDDQSTWIVVDCVDTVVHIFEPNTRSYYDLESMWGDAPKIEWLRPGQKPYTAGDEMDEPARARTTARGDEGDTDEPSTATTESSEPDADADIELTTGTAEAFAEEARATLAPAPKSKPKTTATSKAKAKPAPKVKATKKVAKKAPAKKATAKKPAAKKPAPTKKPAAKATKKAAPAKKPAAKKAVKKTAKKR